MVKTYQNLQLFGPEWVEVLSILESRNHNQTGTLVLGKGLQFSSALKRIACAVKQAVVKRGLRKSSSLTNGISPGRNKTALKEYGIEARGLICPATLTMRPSWAAPLMRTVLR